MKSGQYNKIPFNIFLCFEVIIANFLDLDYNLFFSKDKYHAYLYLLPKNIKSVNKKLR